MSVERPKTARLFFENRALKIPIFCTKPSHWGRKKGNDFCFWGKIKKLKNGRMAIILDKNNLPPLMHPISPSWNMGFRKFPNFPILNSKKPLQLKFPNFPQNIPYFI